MSHKVSKLRRRVALLETRIKQAEECSLILSETNQQLSIYNAQLIRERNTTLANQRSINDLIGGLRVNLRREQFPHAANYALTVTICPEMYLVAYRYGNGAKDFRDTTIYLRYVVDDMQRKVYKVLADTFAKDGATI